MTPIAEASPGPEAPFTGVLRLRDGSLTAAGAMSDLHFARWSADGRLRVRRTLLETGAPIGLLIPRALIEREDGALIAAGTAGPMPDRPERRTMGVGALTRSGFAHQAFGSGGLAPRFDFPGSDEAQARAVARTSADTVVVGGYAVIGGEPRFALARLDGQGRLDRSFGSNGLVTTVVPGTHEGRSRAEVWTSVNALAVQPDGKLIAAGTAIEAQSRRRVVVVARYLPDGVLDAGFGLGGLVIARFAAGQDSIANVARLQAIQTSSGRDVRVVVGGAVGVGESTEGGARIGVLRLVGDGRLDQSFGRRGRVVVDLDTDGGATGLLITSRGEVMASGAASYGPDSGFAVTRLTARGRLDRAFGGAGAGCVRVRDAAPVSEDPQLDRTSLHVQARGRVLLGGQLENTYGNIAWVLARLRPRFTTPLDCFSIRPTPGFRAATVRAALSRSAQLAFDVSDGRRWLGRVRLGRRGPGLVSVRWNLRVRGVKLRRGARFDYLFRPVLLDRRGRVIARTQAAIL
jgi:uncharacterized delta-60 repeat protein